MPSSKPDSETSTPQKETVEQDQTTDEVETSVTDNVPSRGEEIAATLLNDEIDEQERRDLFPEYPQYAAEIVTAMTAGYPFDEEEEYRRIPWIWRVSINATKTLNQEEIQELLEVSLPEIGEPLADWQAVVIGGGIINGLTLKGEWPKEYLKPILERDTNLLERWNSMLQASIKMADDSTVKNGTRYDALRNLGMLSWDEAGGHLTKYLAHNVDSELKQGAVCGLADMHSAAADTMLLSGWLYYEPNVQFFALEGMLRTADRFRLLKREIDAGRIDPAFMTAEQTETLLNHPHELTRQHAHRLLRPLPPVKAPAEETWDIAPETSEKPAKEVESPASEQPEGSAQ
ncbi:MAG: hypothetical protein KDA65_02650 [Planctomycetaceae bacterium]|nr:hypothetical protein [Planctomycetaceae bacterium]